MASTQGCGHVLDAGVTPESQAGVGKLDIDDVKFDRNGLVPAIAQDSETGEVLMLAYMNAESLRRTLMTGRMTYWSRSRQELWVKGETSGQYQQVKEARVDCDGDALLFKVEQVGNACHTGHRSCFFRQYKDGSWHVGESPEPGGCDTRS